jgi:hypothetical protein
MREINQNWKERQLSHLMNYAVVDFKTSFVKYAMQTFCQESLI